MYIDSKIHEKTVIGNHPGDFLAFYSEGIHILNLHYFKRKKSTSLMHENILNISLYINPYCCICSTK